MPEEAGGSKNIHLKFSTCILLKLSVFTQKLIPEKMFHKIMEVSMAAFSQLTSCGRIFLFFFCAEYILIAARNLLFYWQRRQIPTLKKFCIRDNITLFVPIVQKGICKYKLLIHVTFDVINHFIFQSDKEKDVTSVENQTRKHWTQSAYVVLTYIDPGTT